MAQAIFFSKFHTLIRLVRITASNSKISKKQPSEEYKFKRPNCLITFPFFPVPKSDLLYVFSK